LRIRVAFFVLAFFGFLGSSIGFVFSVQRVDQQSGLRVVNVDTGLEYVGIQEAINAPETLGGHMIQVGAGIFREHVVLNKSLSLVGQGQDATVVDGMGGGFVVIASADKVEVKGFIIRNGTICLWLNSSDGSMVLDNSLSGGAYGIRLYHSRNSLVAGNRVSGCKYFGIELDSSGNSTLRGNSMFDNVYNFGVDGRSLPDFLNDIDVSNTVNGKPVRYLVNQRGMVVEPSTFGEIGYLGFVNSSNVELRDLDVRDNAQGVLLAFCPNSSVSRVNARSNWNGVYVAFSSNVSVSEVKANGNFDYGIKFFNCSSSRAFRNNASNNGWAGIGLFWSSGSVLDLNEVNYASYDLHLVYTNNSLITRNTAVVKAGGYSIALYYSHNNSIYHNLFLNSLLFAETRNWTRFTPANSWNNSVDGNFWMSYAGRDADMDGIGDTAYKVGESNHDYHPLMGRFQEFSVNFNGEEYSVSLVSNSAISGFGFDANGRRMSFEAIGQNGTDGFCRVVVPEALVRALGDSDFGFLVNGEKPVVTRVWAEEASAYWYLSFANSPWQETSDSLSTTLVVLVFLFLTGVALTVLWKRKASSK
jgi:parallel beta-helix repeat protein